MKIYKLNENVFDELQDWKKSADDDDINDYYTDSFAEKYGFFFSDLETWVVGSGIMIKHYMSYEPYEISDIAYDVIEEISDALGIEVSDENPIVYIKELNPKKYGFNYVKIAVVYEQLKKLAIVFCIDDLQDITHFDYEENFNSSGWEYIDDYCSELYDEFEEDDFDESLNAVKEDTVKLPNGKWSNVGKDGSHGEFKTKKEADAQRRAMFANR